MFADGAVLTAHYTAADHLSAMDALVAAVPVYMFSGWCLKAAVAIRS